MPISPARIAAFDILLRVERDAAYASELLHSTALHKLSTADHALATELVMGTLRWRSRLDDEISGASSQPLRKLDLEILIALRLAVYQFQFLDRVPHRAALHESVELVKHARTRSAAPFVNAVLRKLSTGMPHVSPPFRDVEVFPEVVSKAWAHPLWLVERWSAQYGPPAAEAICRHDQSTPIPTIRLRAAEAEEELRAEGITLTPGEFLTDARHVTSGDVTKSKAFRTRSVVIQDEASQLVAALIGRSNEPLRILDCCAAPGGKTLVIADRNPQARVVAAELHLHRARLLQNLLRDQPRVQVVCSDVQKLPLAAKFDRVLTDVPCSGTGTLARNPEIKWRLAPAGLAELRELQLAILRSAIAHLAPGGRIVYSTCSLEKEENEDVIETVLAEAPSLRLIDCKSELQRLQGQGDLIARDPARLTHGPFLRTIPGIHRCDGFFAAVLQHS